MTIYILLDDRFDIKYNIYTNIKIKSLSINLLTIVCKMKENTVICWIKYSFRVVYSSEDENLDREF